MKSKRIDRVSKLLAVLLIAITILIQLQPQFFWLFPLSFIVIQGYLFFQSDYFSDQKRDSPRWQVFRFMIFLGTCTGLIVMLYHTYRSAFRFDLSACTMCCFILIYGNYAPKLPYNQALGLRLPWTIEDQDTWRYAHRLVGYWSIPCACFFLIGVSLSHPFLSAISIALWFAIPAILSYHDHKERNSYDMKFHRSNIILLCAFALTILFTIVIYAKLPDDLPMQINASGEANWTLPKIFGIWPLLVFAGISGYTLLFQEETNWRQYGITMILLIVQWCMLGSAAFLL